MFQSTHLHEVRHGCSRLNRLAGRSFNPRTYTRCDSVIGMLVFVLHWFQSTHLHEVRRCRGPLLGVGRLFQSTHLHEVRRRLRCLVHRQVAVSIHAPTRGATAKFSIGLTCEIVSIHAPTRGATKYATTDEAARIVFQSTHLHEVRPGRLRIGDTLLQFQSTHLHEVRQ